MLVKINRSWLRAIVMLTAMLGISSGAWGATTYYLLWGDNNNNPTSFVSKGSQSGTSTWTWNLSESLASGRNYYFVVSTSSTYTGIISGSGSSSSDIVDGSGITSSRDRQDYWVSSTQYFFYRIALSSARTSLTISYSSSTGKYTISGAATTYDVATNATGCTVSHTSYSSVTAGSSVTFTVTPTSGYTYVNATYSGGTSGSISKSDNTFTFTPTGSGTFNVTYALQYTVTPSISGGTVSPSTPQTVASGSTVSFTVTPESGYTYSSATYSGEKTSLTHDGNVITLAPTSSGTLSIAYVGQSAPQVRIGEKPRFDAECGLTVGAYVAQRGCNNITNFTLYYSNIASFRTDASYKTGSKEVAVSAPYPGINSNTNITLTATEVEEVVSPGQTLYLRVKGTNTNGTALSDVVPVKYECNRFVKRDLDVDFRACPGEHQFAWGDMFLSPEPTTWSAKLTEKGGSTVSPATDATADFSLVNGQMIWNTAKKDQTSYVYEFTAKKAGYSDGTATLTITYSVPPASTGSFSSLSASPDEDVTPYTPVALSAEGTKGNIDTIEWTSVPASATFSDISTDLSGDDIDATATFRVNKVSSEMDYTVTVTGYNNTNCSSVSESVTIKVIPDEAEKCD